MAYKNLINESPFDLHIALLPRLGDNPSNSGSNITSNVPKGKSKKISYGDDSNPFLNSVTAIGGNESISLSVCPRGSSSDNLMNTNNTLVFAQDGNKLTVRGMNT